MGVRNARDEMVAHLLRNYVSAAVLQFDLQGKEEVLMRQAGELLRCVREIDERLASNHVGSGSSQFTYWEKE